MSSGKLKAKFGLDTSKQGAEALTDPKPYTMAILKEMWRKARILGSLSRVSMNSGDAWRFCDENEITAISGTTRTISRASVIFALNKLVDLQVLDFRDATGKGGHHRVYYPKVDHRGFEDLVRKNTKEALDGIFQEGWVEAEAMT